VIGNRLNLKSIESDPFDLSSLTPLISSLISKLTQFPVDGDKYPGESHISRGSDLLRLDPSNNFRSLYPEE
jgi:hypothetical protein